MASFRKSLGEDTDTRLGLAPIAGSSAGTNGPWIDRLLYLSAVVGMVAQTSGGVTGGAFTVQLQDAVDAAGTGAADFGAPLTVNVPAGPNAPVVGELGVDLSGARRFVRARVVANPTGGTPASIVAATVSLGNQTRRPI